MSDLTVSEDEQKEAEEYVLNKELNRPETDVLTVLKYSFIFFTSIFGITILFYLFLRNFFFDFAKEVENTIKERPYFSCIVIFIVFLFIGLLVSLKSIVIGFVHLYQHYSPEEVRRNCLFKPTCSEYTILAIEKYGLIKGIKKSIGRYKRCNGDVQLYRIDYP